jgi:hypothetical protein
LPGLVQWVRRIAPDRIQINTVVRPPAEPWVQAADRVRLEEIRSVLGPRAEIVAPFRGQAETRLRRDLEDRVMEMVLRRPVAPQDLVDALGIGFGEAKALLDQMASRHGWVKESFGEKTYVRTPTCEERGGSLASWSRPHRRLPTAD